MAFLKFGAIFCVFLVVSIQTQAVPVENSVIDEIQKIILSIVDSVSKIFTWVETVIASFDKTGLDDLQKKTVEVATDVVKFFQSRLEERIANSTKVPSQDGAILIKCVQASRDNVTTLIVSYWDVLTKCSNPDIKKVAAAVSPILDDLKGVLANVSVSAAKLSACNDNAVCLIGVITEIYNDVKDVRTLVKPDVDALISTVLATWQVMKTCSHTSSTQWTENLIGLADTVAKCIRT